MELPGGLQALLEERCCECFGERQLREGGHEHLGGEFELHLEATV